MKIEENNIIKIDPVEGDRDQYRLLSTEFNVSCRNDSISIRVEIYGQKKESYLVVFVSIGLAPPSSIVCGPVLLSGEIDLEQHLDAVTGIIQGRITRSGPYVIGGINEDVVNYKGRALLDSL